MDWTSELEVSSKKLVPRLGRRAGQGSASRDDFKSEDDPLDSPVSLSSLATATPVAPPRARKTGWGDETKGSKYVFSSYSGSSERRYHQA
ncbi:uncharacterized protein LOC107268109 [Cephus cinctus]|uniref:Uncharacterized protein LOC107268109 n=1 Tax=Cephus cinctus TaxID=211228 RepID=A0AAJ7W1L7_CEPCN|nr:uncharacterized protein LOC107268109 [Cephus cinctus]XP_024941165.1 uncharacterized protein LOC107268109 [Cephus cinctus]